jgi:hypothetical protein
MRTAVASPFKGKDTFSREAMGKSGFGGGQI